MTRMTRYPRSAFPINAKRLFVDKEATRKHLNAYCHAHYIRNRSERLRYWHEYYLRNRDLMCERARRRRLVRKVIA